jgi:hypothetical protein
VSTIGVGALEPLLPRNSEDDFPLRKFLLQRNSPKLAAFAANAIIAAKALPLTYQNLAREYLCFGRDERMRGLFSFVHIKNFVLKEARRKFCVRSPNFFLAGLEFANFMGPEFIREIMEFCDGNIGEFLKSEIIQDSHNKGDTKINFVSWAVREYGPKHRIVKLIYELLKKENLIDDLNLDAYVEKNSTYQIRLGTPIDDEETFLEIHIKHALGSTRALLTGNGQKVEFYNPTMKENARKVEAISLVQLAYCKKLTEIEVNIDTKHQEILDFLNARRVLVGGGGYQSKLIFNVRRSGFCQDKEGVTISQMKELEQMFAVDGIEFQWDGHKLPDSIILV